MPEVSVRIPTMLAQLAQTGREIPVEADTVGGALAALFTRHPELRVHVLDETRSIRHHVSCFHNDTLLPGEDLDRPLSEGDVVTIMQAVAGGGHGPRSRVHPAAA
jgi:molybdopterin converting factor small subunit